MISITENLFQFLDLTELASPSALNATTAINASSGGRGDI